MPRLGCSRREALRQCEPSTQVTCARSRKYPWRVTRVRLIPHTGIWESVFGALRCLSGRQTRRTRPDSKQLYGRTRVQNRRSQHVPTLADMAWSGLLIRRFWVRVPRGVQHEGPGRRRWPGPFSFLPRCSSGVSASKPVHGSPHSLRMQGWLERSERALRPSASLLARSGHGPPVLERPLSPSRPPLPGRRGARTRQPSRGENTHPRRPARRRPITGQDARWPPTGGCWTGTRRRRVDGRRG
jgi:hypothetical protein